MTQADTVKSIRVSDGGDGSIFLHIVFEDISSIHFNPDILYDGHWEATKQADGTLQEKHIEDDR